MENEETGKGTFHHRKPCDAEINPKGLKKQRRAEADDETKNSEDSSGIFNRDDLNVYDYLHKRHASQEGSP